MSHFNVRPEVKAEYLAQRLDQLNNEGWAHELNLATAQALPDSPEKEQAVAQSQNAIDTILGAIAIVETQQATLIPAEVQPTQQVVEQDSVEQA